MRRYLAFLLAAILLLPACAGPPTIRAYQTLKFSGHLRNSLLKQAGETYKAGEMSEKSKERIIAYDAVVKRSAFTAIDALDLWRNSLYLRQMNPKVVTKDEVKIARDKYYDAKAEFRKSWANFLFLLEPWIDEWLAKIPREE